MTKKDKIKQLQGIAKGELPKEVSEQLSNAIIENASNEDLQAFVMSFKEEGIATEESNRLWSKMEKDYFDKNNIQ